MYRRPLTESPQERTRQKTAALRETFLNVYAWLKQDNKSSSKTICVSQSSYQTKHPSPTQSRRLSQFLFSQGGEATNKLKSALTILALKRPMRQAINLAQEWLQKRMRERQLAI